MAIEKMHPTAGSRFRAAVAAENPLQIIGVPNAYCARLAERADFAALYLSGAGVANFSLGLPDLGMTTLEDLVVDVRRITSVTELPLLVDADTGFGGPLMIGRTVDQLCRAGAAGLHLEDQVLTKRCGHRPGKVLVSTEQMVDRIKAAVDARTDPAFVVMARSDAHAVEGLDAMIARIDRYVAAGADMIFAEALTTLDQYQKVAAATTAPILANLTEFGKTPAFALNALRDAGVGMVLYPLSAFRAMSKAAEQVYTTIRGEKSQQGALSLMHTRDELYDILSYHAYEAKLDRYLSEEGSEDER